MKHNELNLIDPILDPVIGETKGGCLVSNRGIEHSCFFNKAIADEGLSQRRTRLASRIFTFVTTSNSNRPHQRENRKYTFNDIFRGVYFRDPDPKNTKDKKLIREIQAMLDVFTQSWKSVYNKTTDIKHGMQVSKSYDHSLMRYKGGTYSIVNPKEFRWSRIGYSLPHLYTGFVRDSFRKKHNEIGFENIMAIAILGKIVGPDLCFTKQQVENFMGIPRKKLVAIFKYLGLEAPLIASDCNFFERKNYFIRKNTEIIRGQKFTENDIKILDTIAKELNLIYRWDNIAKMRVWFYQNKQHISPYWFTAKNPMHNAIDDYSVATETDYRSIIGHLKLTMTKQVRLFYEASTASDNHGLTDKAQKFTSALCNAPQKKKNTAKKDVIALKRTWKGTKVDERTFVDHSLLSREQTLLQQPMVQEFLHGVNSHGLLDKWNDSSLSTEEIKEAGVKWYIWFGEQISKK